MFVLCVSASEVRAEVSQGAVDQAVEAFRARDYAVAMKQFERLIRSAEDRSLRARLQFNIARCHEELGQKREALTAFRSFLDLGGEPAVRARARATIAELEKAVGGQVDVTCGPEVVEVALVGSRLRERCPARFGPLPAGEALFIATSRAGTTQRLTVRVVLGETARLHAQFAPAAPPPPPAEQAVLPWVLVGTGVAAVGIGIGFYASNQDGLDALKKDPNNETLREQVDIDRGLAITGYTLGGVLIVSGVTWLLWPDSKSTAFVSGQGLGFVF